MDIGSELHPVSDDGSLVDASFHLWHDDEVFGLIFASRGGKKGVPGTKNTDYHTGLMILLERLKCLGAIVVALMLDSARAKKHPLPERMLLLPAGVTLPLSLREVEDVNEFRRTISEAQRNVLSVDGRDPKHGNRTRRIQISFSLPEDPPWAMEDLRDFLVGGDMLAATSNPQEFSRRVRRLRDCALLSRPIGNSTPTSVLTLVRQYRRLPTVAEYVRRRARGCCELCGEIPFLTDEGEPYLEVHHLCRLADGGPDTAENAAALCAGCHRELHYGAQRAQQTLMLLQKTLQLDGPQ